MRAEESSVLVVAPVGRDGEAIARMLCSEGVTSEAYPNFDDCLERLQSGAGALLLTEEALELPGADALLEILGRQPAWSELPLIILTSGGESRFARLLEITAEVARTVTLLERPMAAGTLLQAVRAALRSRRRQYQVRDLLAQLERREAALRVSEHRARTFFASEMMGAIYWDMDGKVIDANDKFLQIVGYTREDLSKGKVSWAQMTPPEYVSLDDFALQELRAKGVDTPYEKEYIRKDGTRVPILIGAAMLDEKRHEGVAFVLDITARKEAEEALRRNERRQGYLLKLSDTLRGVADPVEAQEHASRVLGEELGAERVLYFEVGANDYVVERDYATGVSHLSGKYPIAAFGRSLVEAFQAGLTVVASDVTHDPRLSPTERARYVAIEIRAHMGVPLVKEGRLVAGLAVHSKLPREWTADEVDLVEQTAERTWAAVERARAEQALRLANERLSFHVQNTPLAVVEFDAELRVSAWSEAAERMFGWSAEEVMGLSMWKIDWICEEDLEEVKQAARGLASGKNPRGLSTNRNKRKDGRVIWCEWYNSSLKDDSGKMQSILSLVLDITERKKAEAVLARNKEELELLVAERTAALRELVGELEHFSYSITHDMRAPLRAMMGFAEVAKDLSSPNDAQEQKLFLDRIQTAARRMDLLITDALNYSKAVRSELPLAPVDVGRLLRGMVDTYPELQRAQGKIRIDPDLPLVMGNEAGLTQCFSNLLVNAVKFVKPGKPPEVRVWAETVRHPGSKPQSQEADEWVRIWVEDRGIGIGRSMLPRVFDMFARGAGERAGTGIGLALVRKVAERMGGRVGVESQEGRGSKFWLELRPGKRIH